MYFRMFISIGFLAISILFHSNYIQCRFKAYCVCIVFPFYKWCTIILIKNKTVTTLKKYSSNICRRPPQPAQQNDCWNIFENQNCNCSATNTFCMRADNATNYDLGRRTTTGHSRYFFSSFVFVHHRESKRPWDIIARAMSESVRRRRMHPIIKYSRARAQLESSKLYKQDRDCSRCILSQLYLKAIGADIANCSCVVYYIYLLALRMHALSMINICSCGFVFVLLYIWVYYYLYMCSSSNNINNGVWRWFVSRQRVEIPRTIKDYKKTAQSAFFL